jgi:hypothetical protein
MDRASPGSLLQEQGRDEVAGEYEEQGDARDAPQLEEREVDVGDHDEQHGQAALSVQGLVAVPDGDPLAHPLVHRSSTALQARVPSACRRRRTRSCRSPPARCGMAEQKKSSLLPAFLTGGAGVMSGIDGSRRRMPRPRPGRGCTTLAELTVGRRWSAVGPRWHSWHRTAAARAPSPDPGRSWSVVSGGRRCQLRAALLG